MKTVKLNNINAQLQPYSYWKVGMQVYDSWWPYYVGKITKKTKTKITVEFSESKRISEYDRRHSIFLRDFNA